MGVFAKSPGTRISGSTTAGSFGTERTVTLGSTARRVIGVCIIGVDATPTTVEGSSQILRFNSSDLGYPSQDFSIGPIIGPAPATNISSMVSASEIIPLDIPAKGSENILLSVAPSGPSTVAKLYEAAVVWSDEAGAPADWKLRWPSVVPFLGGAVVRITDTATTRITMGDISVPSWASEIIGFKANIVADSTITTLEEYIGYFEITTTIKGSDPQEWPCSVAFGAPLGTPVGTGGYVARVPYTPIYIKKSSTNKETVTAYLNLRTTVTSAAQVSFALAYR